MLRRQVVGFRPIARHVIQFPLRTRSLGNEFPIASPDGTVSLVLPEQIIILDSDGAESSKQILVPYDKEISVAVSKDATVTARLERKK